MPNITHLTPAAGLITIETWKDRTPHRFYRERPDLAKFDHEATWKYRVHTDERPIESLGCDIEITGKTVRYNALGATIAARVIFPAYDGQPATIVPARLHLPPQIAGEFAAILAGQVDADVLAAVHEVYSADDWSRAS